ncbi:DUF1870 family protein [Calidifontibacter sp. DB0510]|uniref:DUF1870 family protein n=1 Tax=Metallococcus carri TaxID=1656884 RepID=A0A967B1U8_9MICO|nr:DUF1870 family protein [Metallococcus carri]NHN55750.1 DUF1870 family protein [Metallococcus carri]NOP38561.1 DUF1870 family protein [Calidifontibacter sp. DB2511S]
MTAAEFRIARERLGVTMEWLAGELGVAERTIRRWEAGAAPIPDGAAADLYSIQDATDDFVDKVVAELQLTEPDEDGSQWVITYPSDAAYRDEWPDLDWPAGWHRAAMGRVAQKIPGLRVRYLRDEDPQ